MKDNPDFIKVLEETARNLQKQSEILRRQAADLKAEATRIRLVSKKAREGRLRK
jgi:hypothetical protein